MRFFPQLLGALIAGVILFSGLGYAGSVWSQNPPPAKARPAIYDFGAGRCLSCREMEKILEAVKGQYGGQVEVRLIYVDQDKDLARRYGALK